MAGLVRRISYCTRLPTNPKPEDAIILDEVDHWIFGNPGRLGKLSQDQRVIGLTATVDDSDLGGMEREILRTLGFRIHEKWIGEPSLKPMPPAFEEVQLPEKADIKRFLEQQLQLQATLLYGQSELLQYLLAEGMIFTMVDESVDTAMLRKLDQLQDGRYRLLAFDSAEPALRGVDYRGHDAGLALLVAKPFATDREKI